MARYETLQIRVEAELAKQATEVLEAMGLSFADAVRLLLARVVAEEGFPPELKVPNAGTRAAMEEAGSRRWAFVEAAKAAAAEVDAGGTLYAMEEVAERVRARVAEAVQPGVPDRQFRVLACKPAFAAGQLDASRLARLEQQRQLEANRIRHLRLAVDLADDEQAAHPLIAKAKERVELWRRRESCGALYIERWAEVLSLPPRRLAKAMASFGEWEDAMFQNSPWSWVWG